MQNFQSFLAILEIILFSAFFLGMNFIFYKSITEVLKADKFGKYSAIASILVLNTLFICILFSFLNF